MEKRCPPLVFFGSNSKSESPLEIKPGELPKPFYKDDYITLYNADCFKILPLLKDNSFDTVLTDPPYGISYQTQTHTKTRQKQIANDNSLDWLLDAVEEWNRVLVDGGHLFCFSCWQKIDVFKQAIEQIMTLKKILIGAKPNFSGAGDCKSFGNKTEFIFFRV